MTRLLPLVALAALSVGCGWNDLPRGGNTDLGATWSPERAVPSDHGLYVPLDNGQLVRLDVDGSFTAIDVGGGLVVELSLAPNGATVIAFVDTWTCDVDDPREAKKIEILSDCPHEDREVSRALVRLDVDGPSEPIELQGFTNRIEYADDASVAIAYLDLSNGELAGSGVVDLSSVWVMNLSTGDTVPVSVGFAAEQVAFSRDASTAVVLSKSQVAVLDLTAQPPHRDVTFPLTLDVDQSVIPLGVELTSDGRYAMVSVQGSTDLYVLDLDNKSVNMVTLSAPPTGMMGFADDDAFDEFYGDRTVFVSPTRAQVDVLEHRYFDIETWELDEPTGSLLSSHLDPSNRFALLYSLNGRQDVYRLDLDEDRLVEYRLENVPLSMHLSPTEEFAIALTRADGSADAYGTRPLLEVLDLRGDKGKNHPYLLDGAGLGVAFSATDTNLRALVLQEGVDYLYELDLYTNTGRALELSAPARAIGSLPDGTFYITHDNPLGLVTFYDPATDEFTEVAGFAIAGLFSDIPLAAEEE